MVTWRTLGLVVVLVLAKAASAQLAVPSLTGRVMDQADILSPHVESALTAQLQAFEDSTGAQVAVLTIPSLNGVALEPFATTVFRAWGLGQANANNGVLLLVARDDRQLRIEVGYGLEEDLTDALAGRIIRNVIVPQFRSGDFDTGVLLGVDAILGSINGTYTPPADPLVSWEDGIGLLMLPFFLLFQIGAHLFTGEAGRDGDQTLGWLGVTTGGLTGIGIGLLTRNWWGLLLAVLLPWVLIHLNRFLERRPRFGAARRKRRRKARLLRSAARAGKSSVVIDGVSYSVSSSSSGGGFSGGGGSSGGGGASGSW